MSVIVRTPSGKLRLYCKGAVSFILFSLYQRTCATNINMKAKGCYNCSRNVENVEERMLMPFSIYIILLCSCFMS